MLIRALAASLARPAPIPVAPATSVGSWVERCEVAVSRSSVLNFGDGWGALMRRYSLVTLGSLALHGRNEEGEDVVLLGAGKPTALLAYLALAHARSAVRSECMELLWSNMPTERSRLSLRQALFQLRTVLGAESIESAGQQLVLKADIEVDLLQFQERATQGRDDAAALFTGRFMESVSFPGGASFEQWADLERARADGLLLHATTASTQRALEGGEADRALATARQVRDRLPRHQGAWRLLLETALGAGDRTLAAIEADVLTRWMEDDDVEADPALAQTLKRIRRAQEHSTVTRQEHPVDFVGREEEFSAMLRAFHSAMSSRSRHLHLTGAAGFGKSRMLAELTDRFRALRARVAMVSAVPSDRALPYALLARIAEQLGVLPGAAGVGRASANVLVQLAPGLSSVFDAALDARSADDALTRLQAMRELLDAVASERQFVLMVDDLHWSDRESIDTLARVIERLPGNVLVISTSRPPIELRTATTDSVLVLSPLTTEQVASLLLALGLVLDERDSSTGLTALIRASGGSPLLIIETVRQGIERGWLRREGDRVVFSQVAHGIEELENADPIGVRLQQLSLREREVLLLLAVAGVALDDRIARQADGDDAKDVLHRLATRGLVTAAHDGWSCVHDLIAERVLSLADPDARRLTATRLGGAIASGEMSGADARAAARLLIDADDREGVRALLLRRVQENRRTGRHRTARDVAQELVGTQLTTEEQRELVGTLPLQHRITRRTLGMVAAAGAVVAIAAAAAARGGDRTALYAVQMPLTSRRDLIDRTVVNLRPPFVVEERQPDGRISSHSGDTIDVVIRDPTTDRVDVTSEPIRNGRAVFASVRATQNIFFTAAVRRRGEDDSMLVQLLPVDSATVRLKLESYRTEFGVVTPEHPTLRVPPGTPVSGALTVLYTTRMSDETIVYAWTPTWGDPKEVGEAIGVLSTPFIDRPRTDPITFIAPQKEGTYYIIVAASAETEARFLLSQTNWLMKEPKWGDGNDLATWPAEQIERAMNGKITASQVLRRQDGEQRYSPGTIGVTAFRVVVDAHIREGQVE